MVTLQWSWCSFVCHCFERNSCISCCTRRVPQAVTSTWSRFSEWRGPFAVWAWAEVVRGSEYSTRWGWRWWRPYPLGNHSTSSKLHTPSQAKIWHLHQFNFGSSNEETSFEWLRSTICYCWPIFGLHWCISFEFSSPTIFSCSITNSKAVCHAACPEHRDSSHCWRNGCSYWGFSDWCQCCGCIYGNARQCCSSLICQPKNHTDQ